MSNGLLGDALDSSEDVVTGDDEGEDVMIVDVAPVCDGEEDGASEEIEDVVPLNDGEAEKDELDEGLVDVGLSPSSCLSTCSVI